MTISSQVRTAGPFIGNGAQTVLPFAFKVFQASDLVVVQNNLTTLAETDLVLSSAYTVTLNADQNAAPGGHVTLLSPLASGYTVTITSDIAQLQPLRLTNAGGFFPENIEDAFDRLVILIQQLAVGRFLRVPDLAGVSLLGDAASRKNKALVFDSAGQPATVPFDSGTAGALAVALLGDSGAGLVHWNGGSVNRTVASKLGESVSVKDYGAIGDGVTDDTAAIQAAIAAVNPNVWAGSFNYQQGGGTVYFPRGVYRITAPLRLAPSVILEGAGCDGWTGGLTGFGLTAGASVPNGSGIFADFGATTETCAIDTQNWLVGSASLNPATNQTLLTVGQLGGTYTYCQGAGLRRLAVFCTNQTRVGVRFQAGALAKLEDVSIIGFRVGVVSNLVWSTEYRNIFSISYQVGIALIGCNALKFSGVFDLFGWGTSSGSAITNNSVVTAGNKPAFWSSNDTNYNGTSIYAVSGFALRGESVTTQHCGRSVYAEAADISFGAFYLEDMPYLSSGNTPGAFNCYNAAPGNFSLLIEQLHSDANGQTLFNHITNTPITLLSFSGLQGTTYATGGTGGLLLGNNVNRNGDFGDTAFDPRITFLVPTSGSWTPSLTSITGTGVTAAGYWTRRGNNYEATVVITGTGVTAPGGGSSIISTPFNGTSGVAAPARASAAAVTSANLQAASGRLDTDANLYISAITSTTRIVVSFTVFAT